MPPSDLTTAAGVIAALVTIVGILWRDHTRADQDDRDQRDAALTGWREATTAINRLAASLERQNARSQRKDDP